MYDKPIYIGYGDLVVDQYYLDNKYLGFMAGGCVWNMIHHLSRMSDTTIGLCRFGNDDLSHYALTSIAQDGTDVSFAKEVNRPVKSISVSITKNDKDQFSSEMKPICKKCGNSTWPNYPTKIIEENIDSMYQNEEKYLIVDSLNKDSRAFIVNKKMSDWKIVYDVGWIGWFRYLKPYEIISILQLVDILHINKKFAGTLMKRLNMDTYQEMFDILGLELLIVTQSDTDVSFITKYESTVFMVDSLAPVDSTGAGDAFFAGALHVYGNTSQKTHITKEMYECGYAMACSVLSQIGSRNEMNRVPDVNINFYCCNNASIVKKKRTNVKRNSKTKDMIMSYTDLNERTVLIENLRKLNEVIIFTGLGASYSAALFANELFNSYSSAGIGSAVHLDNLLKGRLRADVYVIFTYSGSGNDISELMKRLTARDKKCYIITKATSNLYQHQFGQNQKVTIVSYNNDSTKYNNSFEKSFVAFSSVLIPAILFAETFTNVKITEDFVCQKWDYWNEYFSEKLSKSNFKGPLCIDIVYDRFSQAAAVDLESKITEGGIGRASVSSKKNYSHGRFVSMTTFPANLVVIFSSNVDFKYDALMINTLSEFSSVLEIVADNMLDFLFASQLLAINLAKILSIDLSKPKYEKKMLKLYNYKGQIYEEDRNE